MPLWRRIEGHQVEAEELAVMVPGFYVVLLAAVVVDGVVVMGEGMDGRSRRGAEEQQHDQPKRAKYMQDAGQHVGSKSNPGCAGKALK